MVWNYKIMVVITTPQGSITSQMLHFQEYDVAEEAYQELVDAPEVPLMAMSAIRLYKKEQKYGRMAR
jgi:hypothetical protein